MHLFALMIAKCTDLWNGNKMLPPYASPIPVGFYLQYNYMTKKADPFSNLQLKTDAFLK